MDQIINCTCVLQIGMQIQNSSGEIKIINSQEDKNLIAQRLDEQWRILK